MKTMDFFDDVDKDTGRQFKEAGSLDRKQTLQYFSNKKKAKSILLVSGGQHTEVQTELLVSDIVINPMKDIAFYCKGGSIKIPVLAISHSVVKENTGTVIITLQNNDSVIAEKVW